MGSTAGSVAPRAGAGSTAWEPRTTTPADETLEQRIIDLFYSRTDLFPVQWYWPEKQMGGYAKACAVKPPWVVGKCRKKADGRACTGCKEYAPIPVDEKVIGMHLRGMITAGAYQLALDGTSVKWACLDFDDNGKCEQDELRAALRVARSCLQDLNVPTSIEASGGRGFRAHLWAFFLGPVPAIKARVILDAALREAYLDDKPYIERFPKQSRALNGYGNLVKVPFGVNRKTGKRSTFLDEDLQPIPDTETALATIQMIDPVAVSFTIDMKHLPLEEPTVGNLAPAKNFDHPTEAMNRILGRCWYFRELERQQMSDKAKVHYEDWWNYLLMFARFGEAGVDRIMRLSALDERFDAYYTMVQVNYVRQRGYHAPSCKRLREGPGLIHCPQDPLECGAN